MSYIQLTKDNLEDSHICCGISDKKIKESYQEKKVWLSNAFEEGYIFKRLDERAKVFIEYGPLDQAWLPVLGDNYMVLGCFWVSGRYKKQGHGKALLEEAIKEAKNQEMNGLLAVVGKKKFHFMSDGNWLMKQGFEIIEESDAGFLLLAYVFDNKESKAEFSQAAKKGMTEEKEDFVIYYSNRCPFTGFHVENSFKETAKKRNLNYKIIKLESCEDAKKCPTPASIFSLYYKGSFLTTDVSICMDSRFDKLMAKLT
jgi:N-acetylglutamate synthase-like GNAT family acetyltransferase